MIELHPFTENDFELFKSWINNEDELYQFAGTLFSFPLTNEQLCNYIKMTDKKPLKIILKSTNEIIGHCELNYENENNRLSRILIGNNKLRGQKIGEKIIIEMVILFFQDEKVEEVDLNVWDWNNAAIKCYEKVGFKIKHENTKVITLNNKNWTLLNMSLLRK